MHGKPPERHWVRQVRSIEFWGIAVPLLHLCLAWPTRGASLALALVYPLHAVWIARRHQKLGMPVRGSMALGVGLYYRSFSQCHRPVAVLVQSLFGPPPNLDRVQGKRLGGCASINKEQLFWSTARHGP